MSGYPHRLIEGLACRSSRALWLKKALSERSGPSAECSCFDVSALMLGNLGHGPDENFPTYRREQVLCSWRIALLHCVLGKTTVSYH